MTQDAAILSDALRVITSRILLRAHALPVLLCAHAVPYSGGTCWTVSNLDAWASVNVPGPEIGPVLIPVQWLRGLLVGETVDIEIFDRKLTVKSGGLKATTACIEDTFPPTPVMGAISHTWETNCDRWRLLWPLLSDPDENRFALQQFLLQKGDVYATNGRMAGRLIGESGGYTGSVPGTFPWGLTGKVKIEIGETHIKTTSGEFSVVATLPSSASMRVYEVTEPLRDKRLPKIDHVERIAFSDAIAPLQKFAKTSIHPQDGLAKGIHNDGSTLESTLPFTGDLPQVQLNPDYLRKGLLAITGSKVSVSTNNGQFIVLRGEESDVILMAMRE